MQTELDTTKKKIYIFICYYYQDSIPIPRWILLMNDIISFCPQVLSLSLPLHFLSLSVTLQRLFHCLPLHFSVSVFHFSFSLSLHLDFTSLSAPPFPCFASSQLTSLRSHFPFYWQCDDNGVQSSTTKTKRNWKPRTVIRNFILQFSFDLDGSVQLWRRSLTHTTQ